MNNKFYQYAAWILLVVVIGLLVYIFTRPKPVNTLALNQDLSQFQETLASWSVQYANSASSSAAQAALSQDLSTFSQQLQQDQ